MLLVFVSVMSLCSQSLAVILVSGGLIADKNDDQSPENDTQIVINCNDPLKQNKAHV